MKRFGLIVLLITVSLVAINCGEASDDNDDSNRDSSNGRDDNEEEEDINSNSTENGTWYDSNSGLTWQSPQAPNNMQWEDAKEYCSNLSLNNYNDWHLPTLGELRSLIRGCQRTMTGGSCEATDSCLSSTCHGIGDSAYECGGCIEWEGPNHSCYIPDGILGTCGIHVSSSVVEDDDSIVWVVEFGGGEVGVAHIDSDLKVRCVR